MITEKETKIVSNRESRAKEINRALQDAMHKAIAEQDWAKLNTIVYLMQGSNTPTGRLSE